MIVLVTAPSKDDAGIVSVVEAIAPVVPGGKLAVILRDKKRDDVDVLPLAEKLRRITRDHGQLFVVHRDHLRIAYEIGADGVHDPTPKLDARLHKNGAPNAIVSVPAHSDADVAHAAKHGADWVLVSPIFETPGKGKARGLDAIRSAAENAGNAKIIALGGIDVTNAESCIRAGASGIAVVRAILHAEDPAAAATALWNAIVPALR